jgi:hypothetical protein
MTTSILIRSSIWSYTRKPNRTLDYPRTELLLSAAHVNKKSSIIFSTALFATSILAAPHESMFAKHAQPRATRTTRRDGPLPAHFTDSKEPEEPGNFFAVSYNSAWAGAILTAPPTGQIFNAVSCTFTVPTPSYPSGVTSGDYPAAIWVGIDGNTEALSFNPVLRSGLPAQATILTLLGTSGIQMPVLISAPPSFPSRQGMSSAFL